MIIDCQNNYFGFSVAWLNPQAIIDGSLILGSFRTSLAGDSSIYLS